MNLAQNIRKALQESLMEVSRTVLSSTPWISETGNLKATDVKLVASIGLSGQRESSLLFLVTKQSASHIVSRIVGEEGITLDEEIGDGMGEFLNMLGGCIKRRFQDMDWDVGLSLPAVIQGLDEDAFVISSKSERINFFVQIEEIIQFKVIFLYSATETKEKRKAGYSLTGDGIPVEQSGAAVEKLKKVLEEKKNKPQ